MKDIMGSNEAEQMTVVPKILIECMENIASVRVGVMEPLKPLVEQGKCEAKFKRTMEITKYDIAWCDIFISVRGSEYVTLLLIRAAKKAGKFIVYFLDDDLLNIPLNISCTSYYLDEQVKKNIKYILYESDINWCVNELIAKKYKKYSEAKWIIGKVPANTVQLSNETTNVNVIYAGSQDHEQIIRKYISPVVRKLLKEFPDKVTFTFIGTDPQIYENKNLKYIDYFDDYDKYKEYVAQGGFSIGLAPVELDEFCQCKYYNKFIEYTSIGAVGVYTNSLPYTMVIKNEENGLLCDNTFDGWYSAIKKLIVDTELRKKCTANAIKSINECYNYTKIANELERYIPQLTQYISKPISKSKIKLRNIKIVMYQQKLGRLWRQYHVRIIIIIPYKIVKKCLGKLKCEGDKNDKRVL